MLIFDPPLIDTRPAPGGPSITIETAPPEATAVLVADLAIQAHQLVLVIVEKTQDANMLANALHCLLGAGAYSRRCRRGTGCKRPANLKLTRLGNAAL
jgi:hypothetical protein